jgi:arsenate reductase
VREKEPAYAEQGLADADDEALLAAMLDNPRLINRPVVITPHGTRLCRPPETVLTLLD